MVARSTVQLGSGNHWAPGLRTGPGAMPPLPVYHFKWQKGRDNYLQRRAATFAENEKCDEVSMRMLGEGKGFKNLRRSPARSKAYSYWQYGAPSRRAVDSFRAATTQRTPG